MDNLKNNRNLLIFEGAIFIILGMLAVALPGISTFSFELLIGWLFILAGGFQFARCFKSLQTKEAFSSLLMAIIYIIFGILLLAYPLAGVISLTLFLTIFFIMDGVSKLFLGFQMRTNHRWGWLVTSGAISLFMALLIFLGWPSTALWIPGLLIGMSLLFFSLSLPKQ